MQEHTATGIAHYCRARLEKESPDLEDMARLINAVKCRAQGVFLWVRLVIGLIVQDNESGQTADQILQLVNSLPERLRGVGGLYWRMLRHTPEQFKRQAFRMLYIMTEAPPLSVHPLQLDWAAQSVSTQGKPTNSPTGSELRNLETNVTLLVSEPIMRHEKIGSRLQRKLLQEKMASRMRRKLQSHCLGLLEICSYNNIFQKWGGQPPSAYSAQPEHGIDETPRLLVGFMHSTVRDFLLRDFVQSRLQREAFNTPAALLDGAILAFRNDNLMFTQWLLTSYGDDIVRHMPRAYRAKEIASSVCCAFENLNLIVRTFITALRLRFPGIGCVFLGIQSFWNVGDGPPEYETNTQDNDDIILAAKLGLRRVVTSLLTRYNGQKRVQVANANLAEVLKSRVPYDALQAPLQVSWKLIETLLRLGAFLSSTEVTVTVESRYGLGLGYPQRTSLTVWVYILGCLDCDWNSKRPYRESKDAPWVRRGELRLSRVDPNSSTEVSARANVVTLLLRHGAPTNIQLQFRGLEARLQDDVPQSDSSYWHKDDRGSGWCKWGEVETISASEIIRRSCGDIVPLL